MSVMEWKLFDFIKLLPIKTPNKYKNLRDGNNITTTCYSGTYQVLCDAFGAINVFSNEWDFTFYQTKGRPIMLSVITNNNILLTLEQDPLDYKLDLRLYNLNKMMKRHQVIVLSRANLECSCTVNVMEALFIDTSSPPLLIIAIGLSNGCVLLYKGPLGRDLTVNFRHLYVCTSAIKGIRFICGKVGNVYCPASPKMFICTDNTIACMTLTTSSTASMAMASNGNVGIANANAIGSGAATTENKIILDNGLNAVYCCTTYRFGEGDNDYYFIVGRDDALYCYTSDGRGPCFAIEGRKQLLEWYDDGKHLICILSMGYNNQHHHKDHQVDNVTMIVIDIENKLIMLNEKFDDAILCILPIDENHTNCYVILRNLQFFTLRERSIQSKLRLLYNKNLYDIALKIICATNTYGSDNVNMDRDSNTKDHYLSTTYTKYGDYMLQRGDLNTAIKLYLQSINDQSSSASFPIIMKLMDLSQKDYLIEYLTALVNNGHATVMHTELLKNCRKRQQINQKMDEIFDYVQHCIDSETKDDFHYYPIELNYFNDTTNRALLNVFFSSADKTQLTKLFINENKVNIIEFLQKYGTTIILKHPQEFCDGICNVCLKEGKLDDISFRQYIIPILLNDRKTCISTFTNFQKYFGSTASTLYSIWLEYLLLEWKYGKGDEPIHVDTIYVLDFLKTYHSNLHDNDVLIICRHYAFWPGIIWTFMNMKSTHGNLMKIYNLFKNYMDIFLNQNYFNNKDLLNDDDNVSYLLSLQGLSKDDELFQESSNLIKIILTTMFSNNNSSDDRKNSAMCSEFMLKTLQHLFSTKNLRMAHIVEHLNKAKLSLLNQSINQEITELNQRLKVNYELLSNYKRKPIEYRGDLCEICKQPIKLPATFYLCQHSYHTECHSAYVKGDNKENPNCLICQRQRELQTSDLSYDNILVMSNLSSHNDILQKSASIISCGLFYKLNQKVDPNLNRVTKRNTNPFLDDA